MNDARLQGLRWRDIGIGAVSLAVVLAAYWFVFCGTSTTVLLVRHADRQGSADALSAAGLVRAQELAHVLERSGIGVIYTSDAARTQETALPTATLLGITPVAEANVADLVSDILDHHGGGRVLVVGHSNTVPQIIEGLGGPTVTIAADEYDNLYTLVRCRCRWRSVTVTNLQYGAASP